MEREREIDIVALAVAVNCSVANRYSRQALASLCLKSQVSVKKTTHILNPDWVVSDNFTFFNGHRLSRPPELAS